MVFKEGMLDLIKKKRKKKEKNVFSMYLGVLHIYITGHEEL